MGSSVWHCICDPVPTPWLEYVHALVHVFMSIWLLNPICIVTCKHGCHCVVLFLFNQPTSSPTPPLACVYGNMGTPVWHSVCVPVILLLFPHFSKSVYIHQYMYLCPPDSACQLHLCCIGIWKDGCPCMALCVCVCHPLLVPHLGENVYMHQYIYLCPPDSPCLL